jgi:glycerol-3-phosphate dehydrogenase
VTKTLNVHGYHPHAEQFGDLSYYGSDAQAIREMMAADPALAHRLHDALPVYAAEAVWAARHEMARTVEDFLARRTRALFLNARAAIAMAPEAARLMAAELGRDAAWQANQVELFNTVAQGYLARPDQRSAP